jgi:hypothetical protein
MLMVWAFKLRFVVNILAFFGCLGNFLKNWAFFKSSGPPDLFVPFRTNQRPTVFSSDSNFKKAFTTDSYAEYPCAECRYAECCGAGYDI